MKQIFSLLLLLAAFTDVFAAPVAINLTAEKQLIRGYGGINHPVWAGDLTAAQRETAFGNGANQLGFTVLRIWISDNTSQWSQEVATAKKAIEHGAIVFASPWNPPSSMTKTGQSTYNSSTEYRNTKIMRNDKFSEYVNHLNSFIKYMKDNGVDLYAVSVQNEHDYAYHGDGGWTEWTAADILTFMKNYAGNINSRVITPEPFQYRKNELNSILNDPTALANTDIVGTHLYGTLPKDFAYPLFKEKGAGKELWMTEVYHPNSEADSGERWPEALNTGVHVHRAMVDGSFQAYVWWYIRRSYSPMNENGSISKRGWMMAHFSKFVRPGYVRVDATPAMPKAESPVNNSTGGTGGTFVSAYKGEDGKVVIVAVNRDAAASSIEFTINGGTVQMMEAWRTTGTQNMAKLSDVTLNNGSTFSVSLPAQSVTTFVGSLPELPKSSSSSVVPSSSSVAPSSSSVASSSSSVAPSSSSIARSSSSAAPSSSSVARSSSSVAPSSSSAAPSSSSVAPSSSSDVPSSSSESPSSSSEENTPIARYLPSAVNSEVPIYYTIKGEPVGSIKPVKPGVYLVKQGSSVHKIVVR